ncbi:MAG: hypothetical protein GX931_03410 [Acholeplasmataceae bacterium]|nr:hypothetical protein [Acholeplasmataceae bacterium]
MKKLYLSILMLVSMFLLVGCDSKKEIEVTYQEANEMLQSVNVEAITEEILTAKGTFSLDFKMEGMMELTGEVSFDFAAKITSIDDFYMIGSAKGNLNQKVSVPGMTQTTDTKFDVKLYIINNNLYVEGEVTEGGSKTDVKLKKLNVMDEATLQEIKASLSLQGETQMPSEAMITEDMKFKMYKVKEGHLLELTLTLEDMLNAVEELPTGFEKTGVNELILGVTFDDVIKKIDLTFELNFTYDMGDEIPDFNLKYDISAKGEFHISTKGKAPTMPDMDVLNSFPEMDDSSLLPFFN